MEGVVATIAAMVLLAVLAAWAVVSPRIREARRRRRREQPWPDGWDEILARRVPLCAMLPGDLRRQLKDDIKVFVAEKRFVGCGDLAVTDEIRVTIAAQACLLTLNRPKRYYPRLSTVYVYHSAYVTRIRQAGPGGSVMEGEGVNLGESWSDGRLVLAWDAARHGAVNVRDGHNVVFHEFAHQLDQEDGAGDGVPFLDAPGKYAHWVEVLGDEYEKLCRSRRRRTVIDTYGATNPAEFFSTATEAFFEKPHQIQRRMPDLYDELKDYYKVDPAQWQ
jgi:Mlc titration factor MtfA (ptsG expression regulator)